MNDCLNKDQRLFYQYREGLLYDIAHDCMFEAIIMRHTPADGAMPKNF
jgi:hypothetical protein